MKSVGPEEPQTISRGLGRIIANGFVPAVDLLALDLSPQGLDIKIRSLASLLSVPEAMYIKSKINGFDEIVKPVFASCYVFAQIILLLLHCRLSQHWIVTYKR